ncbi:cell wall-binding protein [Methylomonas koyamae]|uniref:cell wall-binding protein n=1 Tax=Methylomonas koyamae TaxID=702114 RepID=UPI001C33452E|nr:cell wall-binding protein [Methylomonas koyamae]BBL58508.1 hypothetical protein MKFW12EY_21210 [Methylomonas koyamae]
MSEKKPPVLEVVKGAKPAEPAKTKKKGSGGGAGKGSANVVRFGEYGIEDGRFVQFKLMRTQGGGDRSEGSFPLCDFTCRIVEEIVADNELSEANFLRIEGKRADGIALPPVDVPMKAFFTNQGSWANDYWGTLPFIYPGAAKKDNLRACIQLYSALDGNIPRKTIYQFIGWKKLQSGWHYLHGGGAITGDGLTDSVQVDLGPGNMSHYYLPKAPETEPAHRAATEALTLLSICPASPQIGAALLAAIARAPLREAQAIDFAIWLHGLTGSRKSAAAAIAQSFFGNFGARNFPANWTDSANDAEAKSHQAKDAVFIIDDFKPSVNRTEADKQHAMAERLIRNTGNQAGRGRRSSDMRGLAAPFNRSMTIVTAEDLPRGQSLLGRLLALEIKRDCVCNQTLTQLQAAAREGRLAGLMSAYLQWLAPRMDKFKADLPIIIEQLRNGAIRDGFCSSHPRAPEIFASLVAGLEVFFEFLDDLGAISTEQSNCLLGQCEAALKLAFAEQHAYQSEQDETERFLALIRATLAAGNAHISNRLNQGPPETETTRLYALGWRDAGTDDEGNKQYRSVGDCLGWYAQTNNNSQDEIWLEPNNAYQTVCKFARDQGDHFLINASTLWRRMADKGLLLKSEPDSNSGKPRPTVKRMIAGRHLRVLVLSAGLIESV